ncbi:MAG: DUF4031 domain-containing protein [Fibrobacteria bacterium]|nr:DUF4031 domain-containing protein [Fibrobacteria bacterium]
MAILLDTPVNLGKGQISAHMVSDESLVELHQFAKDLGLKKQMFQITESGFARYNINISKRLQAIDKGALEASPAAFMKASRDLSRD